MFDAATEVTVGLDASATVNLAAHAANSAGHEKVPPESATIDLIKQSLIGSFSRMKQEKVKFITKDSIAETKSVD